MTRDECWLLDEKYFGEKTEGFFTDLKRLQAGEPLAYIIGYIPFLNCKIWLDSKPLIPRVETEFWVEKAIEAIRRAGASFPRPLQILDLCSGSGCIGIAIAKAIDESEIDFCELEKKHIPTIEKNLMENDISTKRTIIYTGDLFEPIPNDVKYDFIVTNPPYVDPRLDRTNSAVKIYEPPIALYGGNGGLEIIQKIIFNSLEYLSKTGQLWIEHEPEQSVEISKLGKEAGFKTITHTDQYNKERYSQLVLQ
jgi:release factor glutamine methyltransferase